MQFNMSTNITFLYEHYFDLNESVTIPPNFTQPLLPTWIRTVALPAFFGLVCLTGVIGNSLALCVFLRFSNTKKVPNVYILNLASADLLFMIGIPFLTYQYAAGEWIFGELMCKIVMAIDGMNMYTGIFTLTAMSVDRYFAIVHAVWSMRHRTLQTARMACVFLWVFATLVTLPLWIYSQKLVDKDRRLCDVGWPEKNFPVEDLFILYSFVISFILPLVIISACYVAIMAFLAKGSKAQKKKRRSVKLGRVGVMVLLAVALFVVCWLPFWTVQLVMLGQKGRDPTRALAIAYYSSLCMSYANSSLNPIVYTFSRRNFRQDLAVTFCGHRGDRRCNGDSKKTSTLYSHDKLERTIENSNDL
ncbi:somatostatin receptor type 5-like [Ptychodera flava]|uniref:somatostatin receptor type 5-like n=1 Tax=Ptychodera flava TaxID=63121 RepID=UPI00396A58E4